MQKRYELHIHLPSGVSARFPLVDETIRIGRSPSNELCLPDDHLSRVHAILYREEDCLVLKDEGSRNGTFHNGNRIRDRVKLALGDTIRMGGSMLTLQEGGELPSRHKREEDDKETLDIGAPGVKRRTDILERIVAASPAMQRVLEIALKAAEHDAPVLLLGGSGTGKEVLARLIHDVGPRASKPFITVNCPALPPSLIESELFGVEKGVATGVDPRPGKFEQAHGGTLFLDEIGDMNPRFQAKLLRVLEDSGVTRLGGSRFIPLEIRIMAATNHDLEEGMTRGRFREDLYYRLNTIKIRIPPLRERQEDILPLTRLFLSRYGGPEVTLSSEAAEIVKHHSFPGNVRELEQWVRQALIMRSGNVIDVADLTEEMQKAWRPDRAEIIYKKIVEEGGDFWELVRKPFLSRDLSREEIQKLISMGLKVAGGNRKELARLFGIEKDYKKLLNFVRNHRLAP